jgi:hypothetical protein
MNLTFAKNYQPVIYQWFMEGVEMVPSLIPQLFDVQTTSDLTQYTLGVGGIPVETWNNYKINGKAGYVEPERGYSGNFTLVEYPVRLPIKKLYLQTDKTGLIRDSINEVAISAAQKKEYDAANVFNYAWTSGHTGPDGQVLCYASHPAGPDNTGTVFSNTGTSALSYQAMKTTKTSAREWTDGQKNPLLANAKFVLAPIALEDQLSEIFNAIGKPGTANNDGSAVTRDQGWDYAVWDWLTDDESWWQLDPIRTKRFLKWWNYGGYDTMVVEETTTDIVFEFKMTYIYGWKHWSFVYGHTV